MMIVDTVQFVSTLRELTEEGKVVSMRISGNSMLPFLIHERDAIRFQKQQKSPKKGDMVFYQRENGQYVMHRVYKVSTQGYYMIGDAQNEIEGPLREEQIFAIVTEVRRKGKWIGPDDFWWKFFEKVWIRMIPLRRILITGYSLLKNKK